MDDFDLQCLPTNFVGTSKPSNVLKAFYEKQQKAEQKAIEDMNAKKQEICEKYENLTKERSEELNTGLREMRDIINDEELNKPNEFKIVHDRIQNWTQKQHELVESFYANLENIEKDKSNELKENLKQTFEAIKRSSYKLPSEYNEFIELEVEKINQTILCNIRNYVELKARLQAEVQYETSKTIQTFRQLQENLIILDTKKALEELKKHYTSDVTTAVKKAKKGAQRLNARLRKVKAAVKTRDPKQWLDNTRKTLATLDKNTQKLILNYKQAIILIYQKNHKELSVVEEALKTQMGSQTNLDIVEYYTPSLDEIKQQYDVDLETIQKVWNDLVDEISRAVDNVYKFLMAAVILWQKHFKRTKILEAVILKDLEHTAQLNNNICDRYEIRLNKLIDSMRESNGEIMLNKLLTDIKKYLVDMDELYNAQYLVELGTVKKYRSTHELKVEVLLAEINRFLKLHPPNFEKDPKLLRKRASAEIQTEDLTDSLIPNQIMFCKFQIDAVTNWQFGLWESIKNYTTRAKAELMAEADKWTKSQLSDIELRLKLRSEFNNMRLTKIEEYIYRERLEELYTHQSRLDEHKTAGNEQVKQLETEYKLCQDTCNSIATAHEDDITEVQYASLDTETSQAACLNKIFVNGRSEKCFEEITNLYSNYWEKCDKCINRLKAANIAWVENIKLFSEDGNYSVQEMKQILKNIEKTEAKTEQVINRIREKMDPDKESIIEQIQNTHEFVLYTINSLIQEHRFNEHLDDMLKKLQRELLRTVCAMQYTIKDLSEQFAKFKEEAIQNCGSYGGFVKFAEGVREIVPKLIEVAEYLIKDPSGKLYANKRGAKLKSKSKSTVNLRGRKSDVHKVRDLTSKLFNFRIKTEKSLFMDLCRLLRTCWDDIMSYGKKFYEARNRCFFLDGEKIHQKLPELMRYMYKEFLDMQNQCETKTMLDTQKYLYFANDCLVFIQQYLSICLDEYARISLRNFDRFFEENVRQPLINTIKGISNRYVKLHTKLKPSYGLKKNKKLLDNLQIEADIIDSEAKKFLRDIKTVHLKSFNEQRHKIVEEYTKLRDLIPDTAKAIEALRMAIDNLNDKLTAKVNNLKIMIRRHPQDLSWKFLRRCQSILPTFGIASSPNLAQSALTLNVAYSVDSETWDKSTFSSRTPSSWSSSISESTAENNLSWITTFSLDSDIDTFLTVLKEAHDKYCRLVLSKNFEEFLRNLKNEWCYAVGEVMDLYNVKYDQYNHRK